MKKLNKILIFAVLILNLKSSLIEVWAVSTAPHTFSYQGRLLDSSRDPITTQQTIRFSLWSSNDFTAWDLTGGGAINLGAPNYAGYQETQNFTPNQYGIFNVQIGKSISLPDMDYTQHKYLQVEVKPFGAPDMDYEILDPTGDLADTIDRKTLDASFYALNADKLDNTDIGATTGDLVKLGANNQWGVNFIPEGTNEDKFVLDYNDSNGTAVTLQFGKTLNQSLKFDIAQDWFNLSNDLLVQGKIYLSGNTVELNTAATGDVDVFIVAKQKTTAWGALKFNAATNTWQLSNDSLNYSDIVTTTDSQVLTNKTINASNNTISNLNWNALQTRSKTMQFIPEYPGVVLSADGTNNTGTMFADYENNGGGNQHNFYVWTSHNATLQDYDLVLRVQLPNDFSSFESNPIVFNYKTLTTNNTVNKIDLTLKDNAGNNVGLTDSANLVSTVANTWTTGIVNFSGSPSFSAGDYLTFYVKLSTNATGATYLGEMSLKYLGK